MYTYLCNRLYLIKKLLCCFLDNHLFSKSLSTRAMISSLIMLELLSICLSCSSNFYLLRNFSRSDDKNVLFETPEAEAIKLGDLSIFLRVLSRVDLLP